MKIGIFRKYKNSKEVKILSNNFISLSLLQVFGYVFPIITYPYLARVIGSEGFGHIALSGAIVGYFQTIVDFGFNYTATRDVAKNQNQIEEVSLIFSNVLWCRLLLMSCSFMLLLVLVVFIPFMNNMWKILFFSFLLIPGHILCPEWFFQAMERMKYITILNFISKTIFTVLIFLLIKEKDDYIYQPLLISLGYILSGILSMYIIFWKWNIKIVPPTWRSVRITLNESFDVFLNQLFPTFYNAFSTLILGIIGGPIANGLLSAGSKLVEVSQHFLKIISRTFFPFLSRKIEKHNLFAKLYLLLSLFISIILFVFAPFLISVFFSEEFKEAIIILRLLAISSIFLTMSNVYGTNYLIIVGCEHSLRNLTMYVSLFGFLIAFPMIYYFSYIGAALTILMSRMMIGIGAFCLAYNHKTKGKYEL